MSALILTLATIASNVRGAAVGSIIRKNVGMHRRLVTAPEQPPEEPTEYAQRHRRERERRRGEPERAQRRVEPRRPHVAAAVHDRVEEVLRLVLVLARHGGE